MKKLTKILLCLLCLFTIASCGSEKQPEEPKNPDTVLPTPTPNPEEKPIEKIYSELITFKNIEDSQGKITGKLQHLENRLLPVINSSLKNGANLISITGDADRSEIKDLGLPNEDVCYLLKLGSGKGSSEARLTFNDIKISKIEVKASAYFNYVNSEYNSGWHNDSNAKLIIKAGNETKEFVLPGDNNAQPELISCEFNLTTPTNSFELWTRPMMS